MLSPGPGTSGLSLASFHLRLLKEKSDRSAGAGMTPRGLSKSPPLQPALQPVPSSLKLVQGKMREAGSSKMNNCKKPLLEQASSNPQETAEIGQHIYEKILGQQGRCLLLLYGGLGAGKTVVVKAVGRALGIEENIKSPSFNLLNIYSEKGAELYHYDLYRIQEAAELEQLGFMEYWEQPIGERRLIHAIEWPQIATGLWPQDIELYHLEIEMDEEQEERRHLRLYRQQQSAASHSRPQHRPQQ